MKGFICLLRGINVGGAHKIKMADLRTLLKTNGFQQVTTYIQSGNILFRTELNSTHQIEGKVKSIILEHYGYDISVMVLSLEELEYILSHNPFLEKEDNFSKLLVTTFQSTPRQSGIDEISKFVENRDDFIAFEKRFMYLHCPNGYGKTKLTNTLLDRKLETSGTTRNWKTILKIQALSQDYR